MTQIGTAKIETQSGTQEVPVWDPTSIDESAWLRVETPNGTGAIRLVDVPNAQIDEFRALSPDGLKGVATGPGAIPASGSLHSRFDTREIRASDGDAVSTFPDATGNGHDLTAESAPTFREDVQNGKPVVEFGGSDYLTNAHEDIPQPFTVVGVIRSTNNSDRQVVWNSLDTSGDELRGAVEWRGDTNEWQAWSGNGIVGGSNDTTAFDVIAARFDGANSVLRQNGAEVASGDIGSGDHNSGTVMGRNAITNGRYWEGEVAEWLFYETGLDDATLSDAESYLNGEWSVY